MGLSIPKVGSFMIEQMKAKGFRIETLELQGFGSYKNLTKVNFSSYKEVAIVGDNGSGKSTLLEAILFALYGQTRQKTLDLAISLGGAQAKVSLSFFIGEDEYKISRMRGKNKSLLVLEKKGDYGWEDLTSSSIAETQKMIEEIVGISFTSMISTAFMRQGEADRFASATPAEKKDILIEILELELFESIATESRKKESALGNEIASLGAKAEVYQTSFDLFDSKTQDLETLIAQKDEAKRGLDEAASLLEDGKLKVERVKAKDKLTISIASKKSQIERVISINQSSKARHLSAIESKRALLEKVDATISSLDVSVGEELVDTSLLLGKKKNLSTESTSIRREIDSLSKKIEQMRVATELSANRDREAELLSQATRSLEDFIDPSKSTTVSKINSLLEELEDEEVRASSFILANSKLVEDLSSLLRDEEEELRVVSAKKWEMENAKCFSCGQPIEVDEDEASEISERYAKVSLELEARKQRLEETKVALEDKRSSLSLTQAKIKQTQRDLFVTTQYLSELARLEKEVNSAKATYNDLVARLEDVFVPTQNEIAETISSLESATNRAAALETELEELDTSIDEAYEINKSIEFLANQLAKRYELETELEELIGEAPEELSTRELETELEELMIELEQLGEVEDFDLTSLEDRYEERVTYLKKMEALIASVEREIEIAKENISAYEEIAKQLEEQGELLSIYKFISQGASKTGIQSYLLSIILPELEMVVNQYLERMTQGEISLSFVTEKESKDGVITTLEIIASTPAGDRPYSTFSGAERFIMDISMRMALSRLLATRNGRNLRFFVVDEGWGSLDADHTKDLLETIRSISDDFDLIVTVTHVPAVADAFPVKMKIGKNSSTGSFIETLF
jgi:exonuclease SbcC